VPGNLFQGSLTVPSTGKPLGRYVEQVPLDDFTARNLGSLTFGAMETNRFFLTDGTTPGFSALTYRSQNCTLDMPIESQKYTTKSNKTEAGHRP
jgi:hypothetical protein